MIKRVDESELFIILLSIVLWPWFSVYCSVNCIVINLVILSLSFTSGFMIDPKTVQCLLAYSLPSN